MRARIASFVCLMLLSIGAPGWSAPSSTIASPDASTTVNASPAAAVTPAPAPGASSVESPAPVSGAAPASAEYAGSQLCLSCHQKTGSDFQQTMMGNILIKHPRNSDEEHGCESCHGPGSNYVNAMAEAMGKQKLPDAPHHGPATAGVT